VLEPIRETGEIPSRTREVLPYLQANDKFHTLPTFRQETLAELFAAIKEQHGERKATLWLEATLKGEQAKRLPSPIWGNPRQEHLEMVSETPDERLEQPLRSRISPLQPKTATPTPPKAVKAISAHESRLEQVKELKTQLSPSTLATYRVLLEGAFKVALARGYSPKTSLVTFFCPLEVVAAAAGIHRTTLWRSLPKLKALNLIDAREWKTNLRGKTKNGGYLWQVKLDPSEHHQPKLKHDEFKHQWRDLTLDAAEGRTAHQQLQQSVLLAEDTKGINLVLAWALPPSQKQKPSLPSKHLTVAGSPTPRYFALESILDLPGVTKSERNELVDLCSKAIASSLADTGIISRMFYRRVLWNLLRQYDQGNDWFRDFFDFVTRVRTDYQERYAKKAGALLISRLRQWHLWQELEDTPPYRVSRGPLQA
jgi:hypothetical protein